MLCPACHSEILDTARACGNCGADLAFFQTASTETQRLLVLAEQALAARKFALAISWVEQAERLSPSPPSKDTALLKARAHAGLGNIALARRMVEGLGFAAEESAWNEILTRREVARAHYNWALHLAKRGLHKTAQSELQKAAEQDSGLMQPLLTQAKYKVNNGDHEAALQLVYEVLKSEPGNSSALSFLFELASETGSS